jgi:fucose permease
MIPDRQIDHDPDTRQGKSEGRRGVFQRDLIVLGGIAFADMLCEGAAADWAAVYLRNSVHTAPVVAGMGFAIYALAMLVVRLSGNRLFTRFSAHRLLPLLAVMATLGFAGGLVIARPVSVLIGFALLGAGLGSVVPMIIRAAGAVGNVDTGRAVASVAGCGWAGYVVGPVVIGAIASSTTLHTALFLIPVLTSIVAVGTWTAKGVRRAALLPALRSAVTWDRRSSSISVPGRLHRLAKWTR